MANQSQAIPAQGPKLTARSIAAPLEGEELGKYVAAPVASWTSSRCMNCRLSETLPPEAPEPTNSESVIEDQIRYRYMHAYIYIYIYISYVYLFVYVFIT